MTRQELSMFLTNVCPVLHSKQKELIFLAQHENERFGATYQTDHPSGGLHFPVDV